MKKRVLVWLSGWVDSAVSAALLLEQWYEVVGWFMKNYVSDKWNCTTFKDAEEAIKVAKFLWIELLSFDLQKEYQERIIDYIFDWYSKWITPNPDVLCNNLIKFDVFLNKAMEQWFDYIATGHYARILEKEIPPTPSLSRGEQDASLIKGGAEWNEAEGLDYKHNLPYNHSLVEKARELRQNMTKAEKKLRYDFLQPLDIKVLRQQPIDNYIVDFYIASKKLVIEIDWDTHWSDDEIKYDHERTNKLEHLWLSVVRFTNDEVFNNFEAVCGKIMEMLEEIIPPTPLNKGGSKVSEWQVRYHLLQWVDSWKDQSYFLSGLNQYQLSKSIFPLWEMTKQHVREKAKEIWLPNAERKDSQGLCFIWNVPIRTFLMQKFPKKEWDILDLNGKKVWIHQWAYFYTIGQKQWLWLNFKAYVYRIDIKNNVLYVTDKDAEELKTKTLIAKNWHWICPDMESEILNWKKNLSGKIRYRQIPAVECSLEKMENWDMKVTFEKEQRAVAPWQVFVAYNSDECLWNGMIA